MNVQRWRVRSEIRTTGHTRIVFLNVGVTKRWRMTYDREEDLDRKVANAVGKRRTVRVVVLFLEIEHELATSTVDWPKSCDGKTARVHIIDWKKV